MARPSLQVFDQAQRIDQCRTALDVKLPALVAQAQAGIDASAESVRETSAVKARKVRTVHRARSVAPFCTGTVVHAALTLTRLLPAAHTAVSAEHAPVQQ